MRPYIRILWLTLLAVVLACVASLSAQQPSKLPAPTEGDYFLPDFHFWSGEAIRVRMHYATFGAPIRDAKGKVTNAVLLLHATSGTGEQFLASQFAGVLFGPGQLLDITRYYVIMPDNIGHGKSTKPSDGLHAHFPQYNYDDMVVLQHMMLEQALGVNHLRLILGTSMGCMHSWVWGEGFPDFMDAIMALACQPVQIAGRNRIWRKMVMDGIRNDPDWKNGDYISQPHAAMVTAADMFYAAAGSALQMQKNFPTRDATDAADEDYVKRFVAGHDANDLLYALNASRNYDPSPQLEKIIAPVMFVNSADDFINPPELGIGERGNQTSEARSICADSYLRTNPRSRHSHLGSRLAAAPERVAGNLTTLMRCRFVNEKALAPAILRSPPPTPSPPPRSYPAQLFLPA